MRIVIDARALTHPGNGGYKSHTVAVLDGLQKIAHNHDITVLVDRQPSRETAASLLGDTTIVNVGAKRVVADFARIPQLVNSIRPDVVIGITNYIPLITGTPVIAHMLDTLLLVPAPWKRARRPRQVGLDSYFARMQAWTARRARRVVTLTHHSAMQIEALFPILSGRIDIIGSAPVLPKPMSVDRIPHRILALGQRDPRKNLDCVMQAWAELLREGDQHTAEPELALVTARANWTYWRAAASAYRVPEPVLIDAASTQELANAYAQAGVFVFPSRAEGFGLPPLEAMTCGTPVICSRTGATGEVTGDAAISIDPDRPLQLVEGIRKIFNEPRFTAELIERGYQRAQGYTSTGVARRLLDSIDELAR
ncbi:MAG: glycosyltransferase family 4 protein [Armatimonadaceae bacterium]